MGDSLQQKIANDLESIRARYLAFDALQKNKDDGFFARPQFWFLG